MIERLVFLKGRNLHLRPLAKEDLPACVKWVNDPENRDYVNGYWPMTLGEEEEWFGQLRKNKPNDFVLAIVLNAGTFIGNIGIHKIDWRSRVATTGALIGEKEHWGNGYGTEAKILLLDFAFNTLNLHKLCSQVIAYNERSRRYSEKCGYKLEGIFKDHIFRRGQYWDVLNLAVFREDFEPVWEKYLK